MYFIYVIMCLQVGKTNIKKEKKLWKRKNHLKQKLTELL